MLVADQPGRPISLRLCCCQQDVGNFTRTLDMGVVAGIQFSDLPTQSASFCCKWGEEWPSRIFLSNARNEGGWNGGLPIEGKRQGLLKATQTKITQPRADKFTRLTRLKSPE